MPQSTTVRNAAGDPLYRRLHGFLNHLTDTYGEEAGETLIDLLNTCTPGGPMPHDTDAITELKTGFAELESGKWETVRGRLDELTAAA